jgi:excisionase family DNA binding protein
MRQEDKRSKGAGAATISPDELARTLGVSRHGVYEGLRNGSIPSIRLGKRFVIPRSAIDRWLQTAGK